MIENIMKVLLLISLLTTKVLSDEASNGSCPADSDLKLPKPNCDNSNEASDIEIPELDLSLAESECKSKLFFIESSDRPHLLTRQACAVESAIKNAQIEEIYVLMTSKTLNVNNATCQLLNHFNVKFR